MITQLCIIKLSLFQQIYNCLEMTTPKIIIIVITIIIIEIIMKIKISYTCTYMSNFQYRRDSSKWREKILVKCNINKIQF